MGRKPTPVSEVKQLFNCKLANEVYERMRIICFRKSVHQLKKYPEGRFISTQIVSAAMPKPPTDAQLAEYVKLYPQHAETVAELGHAKPPLITEI